MKWKLIKSHFYPEMISSLISISLGILFGIFTGLTPGVHINMVSLLTLSFSPILLNYTSPLNLATFIASMSITHTFLDFIPSCYLGAPNPDTCLSILPSHKMLLTGEAYSAIVLTVMGSLFSLIIISVLYLPVIFLIKLIYSFIKPYIGFILLIISILMIIREKESKIISLFIFISSGVLGLAIFNTNLKDPLFPLFSGLFGISSLIFSLYSNTSIPAQKTCFPYIEKLTAIKALFSSLISGFLTSFLPGLGPAQGAIIGSQITKLNSHGFLILTGALSTINMLISFLALYAIDKARNGAVVIISELITIDSSLVIYFISISLITAGISTFLALKISKVFSGIISKINYRYLCISIIIFITILVLILTKPLGLLVLVVSTALGLIPQIKSTPKNHLMGCLLIPVILYFLL